MAGLTPLLYPLALPFSQHSNGGALGILLLLGLVAFGMACFGFWLWMLIHALTKQAPDSDKVVWVLVIVLLPFLGSLIYFFARFLGGRGNPSTPG